MNLQVELLKCPFCGSEKEITTSRENTIEHDFLQALETEDHSWDDEKRVFKCGNCGAETLLDQDKVADFCSFCGSSHIAITDNHAGIRPALVIPFQITKDEAVEKFKVWMKKKYFAPSKLIQSYKLIIWLVLIFLTGRSIPRQIHPTSSKLEPIITLQKHGQ